MTQTTTDTTALALKLAGAKKPCDACEQHDGVCPACLDTGEVYVLGPEVRVECKTCSGTGITLLWRPKDEVPCYGCRARGWNPLDPRYGWDWMVALESIAWVRLNVGLDSGWQFLIQLKTVDLDNLLNMGAGGITLYDTPGDAFFVAAYLALNLDKVVDTPSP